MKPIIRLLALICLAIINIPTYTDQLRDAIKQGDLGKIKQVVEKERTHVNNKDATGWTSLHEASLWGHLDIVKYFISQGADINATDKYGRTPLYIACKYGCLEVAQFLTAWGAMHDEKLKNGFKTTFDQIPEQYKQLGAFVQKPSAFIKDLLRLFDNQAAIDQLEKLIAIAEKVENKKAVGKLYTQLRTIKISPRRIEADVKFGFGK